MSTVPTPQEAPRGAQYGTRQATEARLDAVPLPGGQSRSGSSEGDSERSPRSEDPLEAVRGFNPPTNLMNADPAELDAATSGLPMPSAPPASMPAANREVLSLLPMFPLFERIARSGTASPGFRRWYAALKATLPPEATVRDTV